MNPVTIDNLEDRFSTLSTEEKISVISHGVALRLSNWRKRLFLAQSKVRFFEEKYHTSLPELEAEGLPNDADREMHEEFILWHHWTEAVEKARNQIIDLQAIAAYGINR